MAYEVLRNAISLIAAADISASQFCFVAVDTAGKAALASTHANAVGVLQNKPKSGEVASVSGPSSITKVVAGVAGVTAGDQIGVETATGKGQTATTGDFVMGIALNTAAGGVTFSMLQNPGGKI